MEKEKESMNPSTVLNSSSPTSNHIVISACKDDTKKKTAAKNKKGSGGARVKLSTDPQGVAARQRRHRISERFKILQSLVPGGSKMDTVSMLEEAIQYVKFLKAQIWLHETMIGSSHHNNYNDHKNVNHNILHELMPSDHSQLMQVVDNYHHMQMQCSHESSAEGFQYSWFHGGGSIGPL